MSARFKEMKGYAEQLHDSYQNMTESQLMMVAAQMVHNRILEEGLMTGKAHPGSIEAIAISLGMNDSAESPLIDVISSLETRLLEISVYLESLERIIKGSTISNE